MQLPSSESSIILVDGTELTIQQVVRTVPDKRAVCLSEWNAQSVYAKLFVGKNHQRYAKRDADGVKALQDANILTPPLLAQSKTLDEKMDVLIFAALAPAENCEVIWQKINATERLNLAKKMCETLAQHHAANVLQTDLYFKNFLYFQEAIYTLDGDGIRKFELLKQQQVLENFATLLSKMDVLEVEAWGVVLLESYHATHQDFSFSLATLKKLSAKFRTLAAEKYAKKVLRTCTDVEVSNKDGDFVAIVRQDLETFQTITTEQLDEAIKTATILKSGRTCTVALSDFSEKMLVIKRYNIKHVGHFLWRMLRKTRAENSWVNAHRLTLLGIPTAVPVALFEQNIGVLKGKAYFLTEFLDAPDIQQFFKQTTDKTARAEVVKNTVQLFYRLLMLKISHGDFKATNIKISNLQPVLIDLDSMRQHRYDFFAEKAHVRDLKRFMQNWKDDASLYNAFLKTFKVVYADHAVLRQAHILTKDQ